jgi:beta-lactamase superfamily II metal-dependent hydrolase
VNYVDVGQGDGCFIVTPNDSFLLVDAGEEDHMYRFLRWRFRHFEKPLRFQAAVISHPDLDHYAGFDKFFDAEDKAVRNLRFDCIYHNGILDAPSKKNMLIAEDKDHLPAALKKLSSRNRYANLLRAALDSGRVDDVRMLSAKEDGIDHLPGYETGQDIEIEVLGPVPEGPAGARCLRWFGEKGKTKNGHSIVLRLKYGNVRLLLGGDLNIPAEQYLLGHYGGSDKPFKELTEAEKEAMIAKAQDFFGVDIAKSCHHGSADVSSEFLRALNAVATVVSSGDNEPHCHPRPEALGLLGKFGRGDWPLIFSTELARSAKENVKHPYSLWQRHQSAVKEDREMEFIEKLIRELGRSVAVYGMITVRTDGQHVLTAQKLEQTGSGGRKWDLHVLSPGEDGRLEYTSQHGH